MLRNDTLSSILWSSYLTGIVQQKTSIYLHTYVHKFGGKGEIWIWNTCKKALISEIFQTSTSIWLHIYPMQCTSSSTCRFGSLHPEISSGYYIISENWECSEVSALKFNTTSNAHLKNIKWRILTILKPMTYIKQMVAQLQKMHLKTWFSSFFIPSNSMLEFEFTAKKFLLSCPSVIVQWERPERGSLSPPFEVSGPSRAWRIVPGANMALWAHSNMWNPINYEHSTQ